MLSARDEARIDRNGPVPSYRPDLGPCWIWTGKLNDLGYGPYRRIWQAINGPVPAGLDLDHLCRVRACCRPDHLEPVSHKENVLRGSSFIAKRAVATHCENGHEWTVENTGYRKSGARDCRACNRERQLRWRRAVQGGRGDEIRPSTSPRGHAKLTEAEVPVIRAALADGETPKVIAARYGVSVDAIRHLRSGLTWRHVA